LRDRHQEGMSVGDALTAAIAALSAQDNEPRTLSPAQLEVAVLDRTRPNRMFKRIVGVQLERLVTESGSASSDSTPPATPDEGADS
jgi:proteasome alpha subunit